MCGCFNYVVCQTEIVEHDGPDVPDFMSVWLLVAMVVGLVVNKGCCFWWSHWVAVEVKHYV